MANNQSVSKKPAAGFYVTIIAALACLAAAIFYNQYFRGQVYKSGPLFSDLVFFGLIGAAVLAVVMLFVRLEGFAPVVLCLASGLSLLMYIYLMVWPIADVFIAIDPVNFVPQLVTVGALLVGAFVLAEIALYMKKSKPVLGA